MRTLWDNEVAELIYNYSWLIFVIAIIIMIMLSMTYLKNKKTLNEELDLEEDEKKKKINMLNKKYIIAFIVVGIISGICFGGLRSIMFNNFSCTIPESSHSTNQYPSGNAGELQAVALKPIIYLYPEQETEVKVKLKNSEKLTCTYPKYKDSWNVIAKPNGDLIDLDTGRNLYALYWEGINTTKLNEKEGFVVKGKDTISFLEEKLEILGLTEREANEFIMYWLPQMESNEYNFIRFETIEEINENMPLAIFPKPDSIIRIMMQWKPLAEAEEIQEQKLTTPGRDGFTVVEWGGSRMD